VYSQYLKCAYSCWGQKETEANRQEFKDLDKYLQHYTDSGKDLGCYSPQNMQTRALTCSEANHNAVHGQLKSTEGFDEAMVNIHKLYFVGVMELYQESLCVLLTMVRGFVPSFCDCEDPHSWNSFETVWDDYGAPAHSKTDLNDDQINTIKTMAADDMLIYSAGVSIFMDVARQVEAKYNTRIVCGDIHEVTGTVLNAEKNYSRHLDFDQN